MALDNQSGAKKDSQSQTTARTAPKNFLNNSRGYRSLPSKTRVLRQITPESSPERSAKSLSHSFFVVPFLPPNQGPPNGEVSNGGGFPMWTCPSFLVLFLSFPDFSGIFPICPGMVRGFSRFVLLLFLGLLRAPTRNSPERVCDTIWTCPEKSGKHPSLETPRFGNPPV